MSLGNSEQRCLACESSGRLLAEAALSQLSATHHPRKNLLVSGGQTLAFENKLQATAAVLGLEANLAAGSERAGGNPRREGRNGKWDWECFVEGHRRSSVSVWQQVGQWAPLTHVSGNTHTSRASGHQQPCPFAGEEVGSADSIRENDDFSKETSLSPGSKTCLGSPGKLHIEATLRPDWGGRLAQIFVNGAVFPAKQNQMPPRLGGQALALGKLEAGKLTCQGGGWPGGCNVGS